MKKFLLLLSCLAILNIANGKRIYVDIDATAGNNDGTSWANAYINLQDAIDAAVKNDVIWVAEGTYLPTKDHTGNTSPADNRTKVFHISTDMKIIGGFNGTETKKAQRDKTWKKHPTILSGDFNNDDVVTGKGSNNGENAYKVLITVNLTSKAVINGFTVISGNANGSGSFTYKSKTFNRKTGGGMYNISSSLSILNCTFVRNHADNNGGGIHNSNSSPEILKSNFRKNKAKNGGGMYNKNSSPTITNSIFKENKAAKGGGLFNFSSSPTLTNLLLVKNVAMSDGGGIYNGASSSTTVTNLTIVSNRAKRGGGMYNNNNSSPTITNTIFSGNMQSGKKNVAGADVANSNSTPTVSYSITQKNSLYPSAGVYKGTNELFVDPGNENYRLYFFSAKLHGPSRGNRHVLLETYTKSSPAINAGDGVSQSRARGSLKMSGNQSNYDLSGKPRINGKIDIGAYEHHAIN
jgi:hypothetical protein